jgi:hypothetical protein
MHYRLSHKTIDDDSHVHAAALAEKRASVKFLLHGGPGKRALLDNLVVGMNSSKKSNGSKQTCI